MFKVLRVRERAAGESEPVVDVVAEGDAMTCVLKLLPRLTHEQLTALKLHGIGRAQREVRERERQERLDRAERALEADAAIAYGAYPPPESFDALADDGDVAPVALGERGTGRV